MSGTIAQVQQLIAAGDVEITDHGYDELSQDRLLVTEILATDPGVPDSRIGLIPSWLRYAFLAAN